MDWSSTNGPYAPPGSPRFRICDLAHTPLADREVPFFSTGPVTEADFDQPLGLHPLYEQTQTALAAVRCGDWLPRPVERDLAGYLVRDLGRPRENPPIAGLADQPAWLQRLHYLATLTNALSTQVDKARIVRWWPRWWPLSWPRPRRRPPGPLLRDLLSALAEASWELYEIYEPATRAWTEARHGALDADLHGDVDLPAWETKHIPLQLRAHIIHAEHTVQWMLHLLREVRDAQPWLVHQHHQQSQ